MINPIHHRRAHGFTLVELLVVIAIIAVLASAGFAVGLMAMEKARKATALNTATSLEQAINNFYNEYGYLPSTEEEDTVLKTNEQDGKDLILELAGKNDDEDALNGKRIDYLSLKEGKKTGTGGKDGIIYDTSGNPDGIYDPWGGPYMIALDLGYNETIDFNTLTLKPIAHRTRILNGRKVAVWTAGADGSQPESSQKGTDDVVTW